MSETAPSEGERSPLLPPSHEQESTQPQVPKARSPVLDMAPTKPSKIYLSLILLGIALFLPLTWALVFTGDLQQMGWFALHPPLQSLAVSAFLLGITPLQPPPPSSSVRRTRLNTHQSLMLGLALPALAVGTAAMWWNKHLHGATHFTTWHSWFGVACVGWVVLQAAFGAATVWGKGKALGGQDKAKKLYMYHRVSGYLLITLALLTAHLGGAHSSWALGREGYAWLRVLAFWVGIPLIWIGLERRSMKSKMPIFK